MPDCLTCRHCQSQDELQAHAGRRHQVPRVFRCAGNGIIQDIVRHAQTRGHPMTFGIMGADRVMFEPICDPRDDCPRWDDAHPERPLMTARAPGIRSQAAETVERIQRDALARAIDASLPLMIPLGSEFRMFSPSLEYPPNHFNARSTLDPVQQVTRATRPVGVAQADARPGDVVPVQITPFQVPYSFEYDWRVQDLPAYIDQVSALVQAGVHIDAREVAERLGDLGMPYAFN